MAHDDGQPVAAKRDLEMRVDAVHAVLSGCEDALERLTGRLSPVLVPLLSTQKEAKMEGERTPRSEVLTHIDGIGQRAQSLREQIQAIVDRVDL